MVGGEGCAMKVTYDFVGRMPICDSDAWAVVDGCPVLLATTFPSDVDLGKKVLPLYLFSAALEKGVRRTRSSYRSALNEGKGARSRLRLAIEILSYCFLIGVCLLLGVLFSPFLMFAFGMDRGDADAAYLMSLWVVPIIGIVVVPAAVILGLLALLMGTWHLRMRVVVWSLSTALLGVFIHVFWFIERISDFAAAALTLFALLGAIALPAIWLTQLILMPPKRLENTR